MYSVITTTGVSFEFSNGRQLFNNLSFSLGSNLSALIGPNGVGKSSLAKLLMGELRPTEGSVRRRSSIFYFPQREVPLSISVEEYLANGHLRTDLGPWLLEGIDRQRCCTHLSGGQWMRVRLASIPTDQYLILDEPTNDLDCEGKKALKKFLQNYPSGALLISHDRECLELCDEILELSNQGLAKFGGGWVNYERAKELERKNLWSALEIAKQKRDEASEDRREQKERQEKRNRQGQRIADRKGMPKILLGARKRQAQATTGRIDVATLERTNEAVSEAYEAFNQLKLDPVMYAELLGREIPTQRLVAEASEFNVRFNDWLYDVDLNFSWRGNIRIVLKGANGSGKSTLLKAVLGTEFESRGEFRRGQLKTLYLDQQCALLNDSLSILDNVREVASLTEVDIRNGLAKFLFVKDAVFQKVAALSGGERLRAALAKGLLGSERPELLILDEPTNNLDLANIQFLENLVRGFRGALIVVSHDERFVKNCGVTAELLIGE